MAPVIMAVEKGGEDLPAELTFQVVVCSIIAAFGGLMFGYDIGISGGVTSMDDFLLKFFPTVYVKKHRAQENNYCKYDNQLLQLFTSSLYLAAVVCSFFAAKLCTRVGRKRTMQLAAVAFAVGVVLNVTAHELVSLIAGRLFLGAGIGLGNQAVPLFISEIAPAKHRGGLNLLFQMLITVGILCANLLNYFTSKIHPNGWRISLGGAGVPALFLLVGSLLIVETPASLIERGKTEEGLKTLRRIRGVEDVQKEYNEILQATETAKKLKAPFRSLMRRQTRPQFICGTIIHFFQQFTGINVVMFYAPVLFQTMGLQSDASLLSAVITGFINVLSTIVAILLVDKKGRRLLLLEGAAQMFISQVIVGALLMEYLKTNNSVSRPLAICVVILICTFVAGFAWSWGPLCWLISSEIYPLESRTAGFFFAVSMNMVCTFIIAQAFLTMLCHMRSTIFFFFAALILIMGSYIYVFLPETKGIPIDEMNEKAWSKHWYWRRYFDLPSDEEIPNKEQDQKEDQK